MSPSMHYSPVFVGSGVNLAQARGVATVTGSAYARVDHGADGLLDIYCYDALGIASLLSASVCWSAWGRI